MKPVTTAASGKARGIAGKHLAVSLGAETHGIPVRLVREIIRAQKITPLPEAAAIIEGVINLRGSLIPIADLRVLFGIPATFGETTCFVVINLPRPGERTVPLGLIVDSVLEVAEVPDSQIEPPPAFGSGEISAPLSGIAKMNGRVMPLLDVQRLFETLTAPGATVAGPASAAP